jgi:polyphosphate kinase 2 (PPK2 family)
VFEAAELGQKVSKAQYAKEEPAMREALLDAQYDLLQQKRRSVVILVNGVDGAGKGESVNLLNEWMDPRHLRSVAFGAETDEERAHPTFWRFWRVLPPKGNVSVLFGSWYTLPILQRAKKSIDDAALDQAMDQIVRFERMLSAEGVVLVKLWFHLSKKAQRERFETLTADKRTRWRVTDDDWAHHKVYDRFRRISERALRRSSTGEAPWQVIDGSDDEHRALSMGRAVLAALRAATVEAPEAPAAKPSATPKSVRPKGIDARTLLSSLDLTATLSEKVYEKRREQLQGRLNALSRDKRFAKRALAVVFEGMDAAGKGGAIRRVTRCLDARMYRVHPVAAPTDEERAQPYLWRFWRHAPRAAASRSSTGAGTAACWWSGSRASATRPNGRAPTPRSTTSRSSSPRRHRGGEVLAAVSEGGAAAGASRSARPRLQAIQDHRRGLAQPRALGAYPRPPTR